MKKILAAGATVGLLASVLFASGAHAGTPITTCSFDDKSITGDNSGYFMSANPWGLNSDKNGKLCITNVNDTQQNPNPNFSITEANVKYETKIDGHPAVGAYPRIATKNTSDGIGSHGLPVALSKLGTAKTSADIGSLPQGPTLNASYDLWLNQNCAAGGLEQGADSVEIMVWLNETGGAAQPGGARNGANPVTIDGRPYTVNYGAQDHMKTLWYVMNTKVNSVTDLDLASILRDAKTRTDAHGVKVIPQGTNFCRAEFGFEAYDLTVAAGSQGPTVYSFGFDATTAPSGTISTRNAGGRCIDAPDGTNPDGTPKQLQLWDCNNGDSQWVTMLGDGSIHVKNKCVDAAGTADHAKVQLWDCNTTPAQKWIPQPDGSILNPASGRCLDADGSGTANGTKIQLYDCNTTIAQKWWIPAA